LVSGCSIGWCLSISTAWPALRSLASLPSPRVRAHPSSRITSCSMNCPGQYRSATAVARWSRFRRTVSADGQWTRRKLVVCISNRCLGQRATTVSRCRTVPDTLRPTGLTLSVRRTE
jgi:hypothetical protein